MTTSRFAPSPTGRLHLGHALSAVLGHDAAKDNGGEWLLRIEDLDPGRSRGEFVDGIFADIEWLGLRFDGDPTVQSRRAGDYAAALSELKSRGLVYPCFCSRADIVASLSAPHGDPELSYPGTCREVADDSRRRETTPHSWRLDHAKAIAQAGLPEWTEADGIRHHSRPADFDDVILARKDAPSSYHLACVVDDAATGVDLVVRGEDLRPSTPIQRLLQRLLGLPEPTYLHHSLVTHDDGRRLAKRDLAPTLRAMRDARMDGHALVDQLRRGELPLGFRLSHH